MATDDERPSSRRRGAFAFGLVSSELALRPPFEKLCALLAERLHVILYPQIARSYGALATQFSTGGVDMAWLPPLVAADLQHAGVADTVACVRRESSGLYHSVIFTKRSSDIRALADLKGCVMAWVDRSSAGGYVVPRQWLVHQGLDPATVFSRETFQGTHINVARAVLGGEADVGATYATLEPRSRRIMDAGWSRVVASPDDVEVIATAGSVPADAIAVAQRVPQAVREAFVDALFNPSPEERDLAHAVFRADGFERALPSYQGSLERLYADVPR